MPWEFIYPSIQSIYLSIYLKSSRQTATHPSRPKQTEQTNTEPHLTSELHLQATLYLQTSPPKQGKPSRALLKPSHKKINKHSTQQLQSKLFRRSRSRSRRRNDFDSPLGDFDGFVASFGGLLCCWVSTSPVFFWFFELFFFFFVCSFSSWRVS